MRLFFMDAPIKMIKLNYFLNSLPEYNMKLSGA